MSERGTGKWIEVECLAKGRLAHRARREEGARWSERCMRRRGTAKWKVVKGLALGLLDLRAEREAGARCKARA